VRQLVNEYDRRFTPERRVYVESEQCRRGTQQGGAESLQIREKLLVFLYEFLQTDTNINAFRQLLSCGLSTHIFPTPGAAPKKIFNFPDAPALLLSAPA
jgi:hypothetical protein